MWALYQAQFLFLRNFTRPSLKPDSKLFIIFVLTTFYIPLCCFGRAFLVNSSQFRVSPFLFALLQLRIGDYLWLSCNFRNMTFHFSWTSTSLHRLSFFPVVQFSLTCSMFSIILLSRSLLACIAFCLCSFLTAFLGRVRPRGGVSVFLRLGRVFSPKRGSVTSRI